MEPITDAHGSGSGFNMQLELEQLQAKVRLLAGGTDGEQLAEVLLDREEELRSKEGEIIELRRKLQSMSSDLVAFEADRTEYEGMIQELDQRLREANDQIRAMKEKEEAVQAERNDLEQLLRNEQQTSTGLKVQLHECVSAKDTCEVDLSTIRMELDAERVARRTDVSSLQKKLQDASAREEILRSEATELEQRKEDIVLRSRAIQEEMTAELATEKESHLLAAQKVKSLVFKAESLHDNLADAMARLEQSEKQRADSERNLAELGIKLGACEAKLETYETDLESLRLEKMNATQTIADLRSEMEVQLRARETKEQQGSSDKTEATSEIEAALRAELRTVRKELAEAAERQQESSCAPSTSAANAGGSVQDHAEEIARIRATNEFLVEELNQLRLVSSEATQLKQQNTELRAKVIRQDAAWKRKIESERRRGHIVDFGKTGKSLPLGNGSDSANIALNRDDGLKSKDATRAARRDESKSSQMARSQDLENADGKAWL